MDAPGTGRPRGRAAHRRDGAGPRLRERGRRPDVAAPRRAAAPRSACGFPGPTPTRSAGSATPSTSATFPTPTCATRTSGPAAARARGRAPLRPRGPRAGRADPRAAQGLGTDALQEDARRPRATARPRSRTTSRAASAGRASRRLQTLRRGRRPARDPGQRHRPRPRGRHRARRAPRRGRRAPQQPGGGRTRPRRPQRRRRALRARTCASPSPGPIIRSPTAIRPAPTSSARTSRSTTSRAAGCAWPTARPASTVPRTGAGIVLEWGDRDGAPLVVSGQAWGEAGLVAAPRSSTCPRAAATWWPSTSTRSTAT